MPKRSRTFKTFWEATKSTRRSSAAALLAAALGFAAPLPAISQSATLQSVLSARAAALAALHVHPSGAMEIEGSIGGGALVGAFRRWQSGSFAREDDQIGAHATRTLRLGSVEYIQNETGDVRQLRGVLERLQRTQDFVAGGDFVTSSQYDTFKGLVTLPDGRSAYAIDVQPPGGQLETIDLDAKNSMIDRVSYDEEDGTSTEDYYGYRVYAGDLVASREVDSNGDRAFDVTHYVRTVRAVPAIDPNVFALPPSTVIQTEKPVTVPLREDRGHLYAQVRVGAKEYSFLIDTGAQMIALDRSVATEQHIPYSGHLEVAGANRTGGLGFAALDSIQIAGAVLPVHSVSVLALQDSTGADGVLGYPFFASAEVTIDPVARTMTFAKPGALSPAGSAFPIDNDRQLVELDGLVNGVAGTFVVDTGNSTEMLLYSPFMHDHPDVVPLEDRERAASDYGVGGSARAAFGYIDQFAFGPFRLFNRYANIILSDRGAFADRFDAGNIGMGILKNFVVTFDEANAKMYVVKSAAFDDGRYRRRQEDSGELFP